MATASPSTKERDSHDRTRAGTDVIRVGGLNTRFRHAGSGQALFLLHGQLPGSCVDVEWGDAVERFADAGYSVYAPDLAGFGGTDNPADFSIEARIAHARAFIDHFKPTRYSLWGSSMGTYMACRVALDDPRVTDIVIMPSSVLPPPLPGAVQGGGPAPGSVGAVVRDYRPSLENARALLELVVVNDAARTDALVRLFHENSTGKNEEAERGRRGAPRPEPLHPKLSRLRNRCFLLWGADDPASVPERALLLQRAIPNAELHVLRDCGHWPQIDRADRTTDLVHAFLKS